MSFECELATYRASLDDLLGPWDVNEGRWTVIKGVEVGGPFASFEDALKYGYGRYGLAGFMAKKIERIETVHHLPF